MKIAGLIAVLMILWGVNHVTETDPPDNQSKAHHTEKGFKNNYISPEEADKKFSDLLTWWWQREAPEPITFPIVKSDVDLKGASETPTLTWIGHSSFLLRKDGLNLLTDPHLTDRASPVSFAGPKRFTEPALSIDDLPKIDIIIISHDHYDHLDEQSTRQLVEAHGDNQPLWLVPLKVGDIIKEWGVTNVVELDWWQSHQINGWTLHCVPVQHFSGRSMGNRFGTLWAGWVIETSTSKVFFGGDTGYSKDFKDIHAKFGDMDLSLIPIGAYDPRWFMKNMHVNPEEAVRIHEDLNSTFSVGMHWGTFMLTDEPMDEPPVRLKAAMEANGHDPSAFIALKHGETVTLDQVLKTPVAVIE